MIEFPTPIPVAPFRVYLRFTDRAAALVALDALLVTDKDGVKIIPADGWFATQDAAPIYFNLCEIGVISKLTGGTPDKPIYTALAGWHVNLLWDGDLAALPAAIAAVSITPATPSVVFG